MIKNIIFDIGNVLLEFDPKKYFSKIYENEKFSEEICTLMMSSNIWKKYDLGIYDLREVKTAFKQELPKYHNEIEDMLSVWVKILEPIDYTLEKMQMLKRRGYGVYLLSNLNREAYDYIKSRYFIFDYVDGYVLSYQEQLAKPDLKIYELLCERYSLCPKECVFIDDLKENVEAAIAHDMCGIQFFDPEQVEAQLEALLKKESVC